jgi:hypothetical protein
VSLSKDARVSKDGRESVPVSILRDAVLRTAPQDEVRIPSHTFTLPGRVETHCTAVSRKINARVCGRFQDEVQAIDPTPHLDGFDRASRNQKARLFPTASALFRRCPRLALRDDRPNGRLFPIAQYRELGCLANPQQRNPGAQKPCVYHRPFAKLGDDVAGFQSGALSSRSAIDFRDHGA